MRFSKHKTESQNHKHAQNEKVENQKKKSLKRNNSIQRQLAKECKDLKRNLYITEMDLDNVKPPSVNSMAADLKESKIDLGMYVFVRVIFVL